MGSSPGRQDSWQVGRVEINGPTNFLGDNDSVVRCASDPITKLNKKHNQTCYHMVREAAAMKEIRAGKESTHANIADLFTKMIGTSKRRFLLECVFVKGSKIGKDELPAPR